MLEFRKISLEDEKAYREFETAMLENKKSNPFVDWWYVEDFRKFVADNAKSEIKQEGQAWSAYTRYFAFLGNRIIGFVICFWEMDHPDCQKLGHVGYMVAPEYRRQGFAFAFVKFAQEKYKKRGIQQVYLTTDQENQASRKLIEKLGGKLVALEEINYQGQKMQSARYQLETEV